MRPMSILAAAVLAACVEPAADVARSDGEIPTDPVAPVPEGDDPVTLPTTPVDPAESVGTTPDPAPDPDPEPEPEPEPQDTGAAVEPPAEEPPVEEPPAEEEPPVEEEPSEEPPVEEPPAEEPPAEEEPPIEEEPAEEPPVEEAPPEEPPVPLEDTERAIVGGNLLITRLDNVVSTDPEGDRVVILQSGEITPLEIALEPGEMPFRIVEDPFVDDLVYITARRSGDIVVVDALAGVVVDRWETCPEPRGLDTDDEDLFVACAGGEFLRHDLGDGSIELRVFVEPDLRDVVFETNWVWVSRLRSADVLRLDVNGLMLERYTPPDWSFDGDTFSATGAWRMIEHPTSAGVLVSHQRGRANDINLNEPDNPDPYAGPGCTPILHSAVSHVQFGSVNTSGAITDVALPVDLYADAGTIYMTSAAVGAPVDVTSLGYDVLDRDGECMTFGGTNMPHTSATSAAAMDQGGYWVSAGAGPYALSRGDYVMPVTPGRAPSQGWINFHTAPSNDLACASCHPEGQDDGHVWSFTGIGPRRTQSVSIGVRGTEPLHWDGDLVDMHALVTEVFVNRMGGFEMGHAGEESLMEFLDGLVPVRGVTYASAEDIELGRELFENPAVGCTDCHSGDKFTNNETRLVGTGDDLQVPSLVGIGSRPPYMHDGCAPTLLDRFLDDTCGGGDDHGFTAILSDVQIGLVVEYLNTL